ncbi:MAG: hypothetical protein HZA11_09295 [Nitrospirae bacterium]|nr:hypothetical protein [Nitrospirota bacterium]
MAKTNFVDGNPQQGVQGTIVNAAFLNKLFGSSGHRHDGADADGSAAIDYAADTGAANAYVIALVPALTEYIVGMPIHFMAANANTGASTLNVNGLGAKDISKSFDQPLAAGDIKAGQIITVVYDGVDFQMISLLGEQHIRNKNTLLNGDGIITERALGAAVNDDVYTFDRWIVLSDGNGVVTPSQESVDLPSGARAAMKLTIAVANKKFGLLQIVENANCARLINSIASLGAKAKALGLNNLRVAILSWQGAKDSVTSDVVAAWGAEGVNPTLVANWVYENAPANLALSANWQDIFKAENINIDAAGAKNVAVFLWLDDTDAAINDYLLLTDIQFEHGVRTDFERRDIGQEKILCMRYFEKSYDSETAPGTVTVTGSYYFGYLAGNAIAYSSHNFKVCKRVIPSFTPYSPNSGASGYIYMAGGPGGDRVPTVTVAKNNYTINLAMDSGNTFINWHFAADAEL